MPYPVAAVRGNKNCGGPAFSPLDLSPVLWLKADAITGLSDGDAVASWADQSGAGHDFSQATPEFQPLLKTGANGIGGKNAILGDGVNDKLTCADNDDLDLTGDHTIIVVIQTTDTAGTILRHYNGGGWFWSLGILTPGKMTYYSSTKASWFDDTAAAVNDGNAHILIARRGSGTFQFFTDGAAGATEGGHGNAAPTADIDIGNEFNALIAEVIIYATALSASDRGKVEDYLSAKYGI